MIAFSAGQLAIVIAIMGTVVWWGFRRLVGGMDARFDKIDQQINEFRKEHITRSEFALHQNSVDRRFSDSHRIWERAATRRSEMFEGTE